MNKIFTSQMQSCLNDYLNNKNNNTYEESLSGCGSDLVATNEIRENLPKIFENFNIKSVVDAPCGDWNWMRLVNLEGIDYIGYDILEDILSENIVKYKKDNIDFEFKDITNDVVRKSDLIICRDFMFHISNEKGIELLDKFKQSGSKYLMLTSYNNIGHNDILGYEQWGFRPINLKILPFNLGEPIYGFVENHPSCNGRGLYIWEIN